MILSVFVCVCCGESRCNVNWCGRSKEVNSATCFLGCSTGKHKRARASRSRASAWAMCLRVHAHFQRNRASWMLACQRMRARSTVKSMNACIASHKNTIFAIFISQHLRVIGEHGVSLAVQPQCTLRIFPLDQAAEQYMTGEMMSQSRNINVDHRMSQSGNGVRHLQLC